MVAYERDVQTFLTKSQLLLEAFPEARLSTKYKKFTDDKAFITAKVQDDTSNAVVKFKTDKTIELGRLMVGCTKLSATFANRNIEEESPKDVVMQDVKPELKDAKEVKEVKEPDSKPKKKKKKGKK